MRDTGASMGKAKRARGRERRKRERDGESGGVDPRAAASDGPEISVDALEDPDPSAREGVLVALAHAAADPVAAMAMADKGIVRKLGQRLFDGHANNRVHAAGALRNMSASGRPRCLDAMIAQNAHGSSLSVLNVLLQAEERAAWSASEAKVVEELLVVLAQLAQHHDAAAAAITVAPCAQLVKLFVQDRAALSDPLASVSSASWQLLHVCIDGNPALVAEGGPQVAAAAAAVASGSAGASTSTRLHAAGFLGGCLFAAPQLVGDLSSVLSALRDALSVGVQDAASALQADAQGSARADAWKRRCMELQAALEVVITTCNLALRDGEGEEDFEWGFDEEDKMEEAAQGMEHASAASSGGGPTPLEAVRRPLLALVWGVMDAVLFLPQLDAAAAGLKPVADAVGATLQVRCKCALALGAVLSAPSMAAEATECFGSLASKLGDCLAEHERLIATFGDRFGDLLGAGRRGADDYNWLSCLTGTMLVLQRSAGVPPMALDTLRALAGLRGASLNAASRGNAVAMLGGFAASISAEASGSADAAVAEAFRLVVKEILASLREDADVLVQVIAVDALVDAFSEDATDGMPETAEVVRILDGAVRAVSAKARSEGEQLGRDAFAHTKEVLLNAKRFVSYKRARR